MPSHYDGHKTLKQKRHRSIAALEQQIPAAYYGTTSRSNEASGEGPDSIPSLINLPNELLVDILCALKPSDILNLLGVSKGLNRFITANEQLIASAVISFRYPLVAKCFPLPNLKLNRHRAIRLGPNDQRAGRTKLSKTQVFLWRRRQGYSTEGHARWAKLYHPIDWRRLCSCTACLERWIKLNTVLDRWGIQGLLDKRETFSGPANSLGFRIDHESPRPSDRRRFPHYAAIILRATTSPLRYAALLEKQLATVARMSRRKHEHLMQEYEKDPSSYDMSCPALRAHCRKIEELDTETDECLEKPTDRYLYASNSELNSAQDYYRMATWLPNRLWRQLESPDCDTVAGRWEYFVCEGNLKRSLAFGRTIVEPPRPVCTCPFKETRQATVRAGQWWHEL